MEAPESALVLPVPGAEEVVGRHRARLDPAAGLGVPAHITILYPFVDPMAISPRLLDELTALFEVFSPIEFALAEVGWFGDTVVWLRPEPIEPMLRLIGAVQRRYPDLQPYGGAYEEVIPHLTVGQLDDAGELRRAAAAVAARLPIPVVASHVDLMTGNRAPGSWQTVASFPLTG